MFIKKKIFLKSGNGGDGLISFNNEIKDGGDGGDGGDVFLIINNNNKLIKNKKYSAENGKLGKNNSKKGKKGKDLIINFPIGTLIKFKYKKFFFVKNNIFLKILNGGKGGKGNRNYINKNHKIASLGETGKIVSCIILYKFFLDNCFMIFFTDKFKINNFNYKNNFISKLYIIMFNFNSFKIIFKIIKFFLYFLYLKNLNINNYWVVLNFNIFFKNNLNFLKYLLCPIFLISFFFNLGYKKLFHYLKLWKNS